MVLISPIVITLSCLIMLAVSVLVFVTIGLAKTINNITSNNNDNSVQNYSIIGSMNK